MSNPLASHLSAVVEIAINRVLPLDPCYEEKLKPLSGRVIALSLTDWQLTLYFLPNDHQFIVMSCYEGEADVKLTGKSWDFFRMGINQVSDNSVTVDSCIHFEGDVATGQRFQQLFMELNIDWEEALAETTGDIIAHQAVKFARHAGNLFNDIFNNAQDNMSEYFQEEIKVTPSKIEVENFFDDVAEIVSDSEDLIERFNQIYKTHKGTL